MDEASIRLSVLAVALMLDRWLGEPDWLWSRLPHPVVLLGRIVAQADDGERRSRSAVFARGLLLIAVLALVAWAVGLTVDALAHVTGPLALLFECALVAILLAQRSLIEHVLAVEQGLERSVDEGRRALSMIVGRVTDQLDPSEVRRAALESLAENAADGIVAPVFWYLLGGLPGIVFYKAVNTADSMIGHRSERHEWLGKPAARLDDAMNWVPARLTALFFLALAGVREMRRRTATVVRDARRHRSPNAGWPEAAAAVALDLRFGGPRRYGTGMIDGAVLNAQGREQVSSADLRRGVVLFSRVCWLLFALAVLGFLVR